MAERKHRRVIQQPDRRANRTILVRTLILLAVFGVAAFVPLFVRLWQLQIRDFGTYQSGAVENQTADTTVAAQRGAITDRNGEVLAMSATVYNIQLSPKEILECQEKYREKAACPPGPPEKCRLLRGIRIRPGNTRKSRPTKARSRR